MEPIFANTIGFSNHLDAIRMSQSDRRFFVDCNYESPRPKDYYDRIWQEIERDLPAHWLAYLKKRDVSKFAWSSAPPDTRAKSLMQSERSDIIETIMDDCIEEKLGPFVCDIIDAEVARDYIVHVASAYGIHPDKVSIQTVGRVLNAAPPLPQQKYKVARSIGSRLPSRVRCRCLRNIEHWSRQSPDAISDEYERAVEIRLELKKQEEKAKQNR